MELSARRNELVGLRRGAVLLSAALAAGLLGGVPAQAVSGGSPATDTSLSFVAKVDVGDARSCTGTLVDPWWVLTATSCFADDTGAAVPAGAPSRPTTVTVGRLNLTTDAGAVRTVTRLVPHPDRDVVLAELSEIVTGIVPAQIAAEPVLAGETLQTAGYGRTADTWVPDRLHTAQFSVEGVAPTTVDLAPKTPSAGLCKGDAGGPALRYGEASFTLVAVQHASWQNGCLGEDETRTGAVSTRVDDLRPWIEASLPRFATGFESADPRLHWQNSAGTAGVKAVGGICCSLPGPELKASPEVRHGGAQSLLYAGLDTSATSSFAYLKAFDLSQVVVTPGSALSYWIFPQSTATNPRVTGSNSTCVAVDLRFGNGKVLRDSDVTDQRGNKMHPRDQCQKLTLDTWNHIVVPLGGIAAGQRITQLSVGYDQPESTGGYRGYIDDLSITNIHYDARLDTGVETGQTALSWTSTPDTAGGVHGVTTNIGGICCGLTGPELKVTTGEKSFTGTSSVLYSGVDNSATKSSAYLKAFALTSTFVTPATVLSYWIFPQSSAANAKVSGSNSTCVAVDLILADRIAGTEMNLRDSGAADQRGNRVHPAQQCTKLTLDTWNNVTVRVGGIGNGKEITQVNVAYDQPANTGGFRGYVDDIRISDTDAGNDGSTAIHDAAVVEDYSYPGGADLEISRHIKLISGDGRITLLDDCTTTEPKIQVETFAAGSERYYCFAVKGDQGTLKLEVPNVYLIFAGDEPLNAKYTVGGVADDVDIRAGGLEGIGASDPDAAVLLELHAGA